jgi:preprotein translocase subunit SecG
MKSEFVWNKESGINDEKIGCNYLTYVPPQKYTWNMNLVSNFTSTANAQSLNNLATTDNLLSVPLYIIVFFFLIFTVTMSLIYMYHWMKFNLNDPFIKAFSIIYFAGLCGLLVPLLYNLIVY